MYAFIQIQILKSKTVILKEPKQNVETSVLDLNK